MFSCLAVSSAWADSGLYLFGKEVSTTTTWQNVEAKTFKDNAEGWISYNHQTKTLKFYSVSIYVNDKTVIYNKGVEGLEVLFDGSCSLHSSNKVIRYDVATTLRGLANSYLYLGSYDDEECIYSNQGSSDEPALLTIADFPDLQMVSMHDYCISYKRGGVTIEDSHVKMQGSKGTIHGNYFGAYFSRLIMRNCHFLSNYTMHETDVVTYETATKYNVVKQIEILRSSECTGVRLNGEAILPTDSRWNASTNTLTLNASVNASSNYTYPAAIEVEKPGITIDGGRYSFIGYRYGMSHDNFAANTQPISVRNISLSGPFAGIYGYGSGVVNIGDAVNIFGSDYGVRGGYITFCPTSNQTVNIQPLVTASNPYNKFQKKAILVTKLKLNECDVIMPQGAVANDTTIVGTGYQYQTIIKGWEKYDLYVGGTQVHEKNKDNLTSLLSYYATGTLKFDPSTKTLTMNNLRADISYSTIPIYSQYGMGGMAILAEGENEITTSSSSNYVIYSRGDVIITGNTTSNKLTLKGAPKYAFIQAGKPIVKYITLNIEGNGNQLGIYNNVSNACGSLSYLTLSIKNTSKPLAGMWAADSPLYGVIPDSEQDITLNPSTKELVYCDDYGPTTIPVTDDVTIYRLPDYKLTIDGSKPQSYSSADGAYFDEFSRRLYLRNAYCGRIYSNIPKLKIHTIGSSVVTGAPGAISTDVLALRFTGPGTLTVNSDSDCPVRIYKENVDVQILNTTLKMNGKYGIYYYNRTDQSELVISNSRVEVHTADGSALHGFGDLRLKNCVLQTPQGGYYANRILKNADGTEAYDMLILPETPEEIALDAHANNDSYIFSNYGKEGVVTINNLTIKGNGTWRTICLPFNVKRIGSVLQNCDIREYSKALSRQQGDIEILDFTTSVSEMKANVPYIIRNTSGTDIVNPNFGYVKLAGSKQSVYMGISLGGNSSRYFAGSYAQREETGVHVLEEGSMELVRRDRYTADAFEPVFGFGYKDTGFKVVYTGSSEDELIDGIHEIKDEELRMKNEGEWYSLDGCKLSGKPTKAGIYINGGRKVVVK